MRRDSRLGHGIFGAAMAAFGGIVFWAGYHDYGPSSAVALIGLALLASAAWIGLGGLIWPRVDTLRIFGGVLCLAICCAALVVSAWGLFRREWAALLLAPIGLLWGVGGALVLDLHHKLFPTIPVERKDRALGGVAAVLAGTIIAAMASQPDVAARGYSPWAGVAGGAVFFLAGVMLLSDALGWFRKPLVQRLLAALLLSCFAAVAVYAHPIPGVLTMSLALHGWIWFGRGLAERKLGRDPLAHVNPVVQLFVAFVVASALVALLAIARHG